VSIYWIPGYEGISENEKSDKRAKAVAETGKEGSLDKQCKLASAVEQWVDAWKEMKVAVPTRRRLKAPNAGF
jgi:hypothetical protein